MGTKKINSSRLKILYKVNEDIINKMIELDGMVFKEEDRGTLKGCKEWLKCNPDIYTVILYDDEVIGYINFMPITTDAYVKIYKGQLKDYELQPKDIIKFFENGTFNYLFTSIVIKPEYQDTNVVRELWNGFLKNLMQKEIGVDKVIADCVSQDGENFVKRNLKARFITNSDNGKIYEGYIDFN